MMKRIARLPGHNIPPMLDWHAQLQRILRRYLPPSTADLYATPKLADGGIVEWYSGLGGQPVAFSALGAAEAAVVRRVLDQHLAAVRAAADQLPAGNDSPEQMEQARQLLRAAAQVPADEQIYVLNGQPVITLWGGGGVPGTAPDTGSRHAPAPAAAAAAAGTVQRWWYWRRVRRWRWLWLLLLLLLLALLAWWWFCHRPTPSATAIPVIEAELCPEESALEPPPGRAAALAPELVIVFDASGSMDSSLNSWLWHLFHLSREPRRISAARAAAGTVVRHLPADVNAGLVLLEHCPVARRVGFFPPAQRDQLLGLLDGITPQGGTALADGIASAATMLDGVRRESVLLVISDGGESCGGDACAVAARLAREKPQLKINVVDIGGTGAGNCLAQATGGQVFTATTAQELQQMTTQAARDVLRPERCRR